MAGAAAGAYAARMGQDGGREALEAIVRGESGRVLASLIARFGDFDLAEDALQDAVEAALERWPRDGVPERPAAWLTVAARRRAVDRLRHAAMRADKAEALRASEELRRAEQTNQEADDDVPDERLRLLFTCCHPALSPETRVALTLRTLGGLSTEAVARAFLLPVATLAKRLERAKHKIRDARIPYRVPPEPEWASRLASVLAVVYLIFNEGYSATEAEPAARRALCEEAIRLARMLAALAPQEGEAHALLALLLLHDARRDARSGAGGAFVPLDEQDRGGWRPDEIRDGLAALRAAAACPGRGSYQVQAAIAAAHVVAPSGAETPWATVAALYAELEALAPSPVVRVNRAVALGRARGPEAGLALLAALEGEDARRLADYQPYHAARADLLRRAGRREEAAVAYRTALELCRGEPERRFLAGRLAGLES
jgi:RNA polymerase sigma-70 factor (ECF subfamily)